MILTFLLRYLRYLPHVPRLTSMSLLPSSILEYQGSLTHNTSSSCIFLVGIECEYESYTVSTQTWSKLLRCVKCVEKMLRLDVANVKLSIIVLRTIRSKIGKIISNIVIDVPLISPI